MCGLLTALALAGRGGRITLLERDDAPPQGDPTEAFEQWHRRGAAQFRHPHAFLGRICNLIEQRYPDLMAALYEAGARRLEFVDVLPSELRAGYRPRPGDERLWMLLCRRATFETVLRRHVSALPEVEIESGVQVEGLLTGPVDGGLAARGLQVRPAGERQAPLQEMEADLVIDATGRTSPFPRWLHGLGRCVDEERVDAEIVYYTRHYRLRPGQDAPPRGTSRGAGDLGYLKFGVFPGEDGHFSVILCVPVQETALKAALRDPQLFDLICAHVPGLSPWFVAGMAQPTTESFGIGDIHSVWRSFVRDGQPLLLNFFAVGDAVFRTNPLYGRGCSTGAMHAHILADVLADESNPVSRALAYERRTRQALRPIYEISLRDDRNGIRRAAAQRAGQLLDQERSLRGRLRLVLRDALSAAARQRMPVLRGVMRTFHLLERPGAFLKQPLVLATVAWYVLRGRRRNAQVRLQRGPSRAQMLDLIEAAAPGVTSNVDAIPETIAH